MASTSRQIYSADRRAVGELLKSDLPKPSAALINRDLSPVEFFRRVLEEGLDQTQPLLERFKFLSIFSSNLDEFFMVRVSGLKERPIHEVGVSPDGLTRAELLTELRARLSEMIETQMNCLRTEIFPELARNGIVLEKYESLPNVERKLLDEYFRTKIYPLLTPQAVDPTHPFPYISGGSLNVGLRVKPKLHRRVARALENIGDEFLSV